MQRRAGGRGLGGIVAKRLANPYAGEHNPVEGPEPCLFAEGRAIGAPEVRRDAATTAPLAEAVVKLAREHGMPLYRAYGGFLQPPHTVERQ
jgi:hypothetical protein